MRYFYEYKYKKGNRMVGGHNLEKIEFYENNMDQDYIFTINPELDLSEQNISPEANAIIINLFTG